MLFYVHYAWLLHNSIDNNVRNYPVVTKLHMMYHVVDLAKFMNPRFCWAYEWEHFMNTIVTAAKACLVGSPMTLIGNKVVQNVYVVLDLELKRASQ